MGKKGAGESRMRREGEEEEEGKREVKELEKEMGKKEAGGSRLGG
jgi:hypothetical protein